MMAGADFLGAGFLEVEAFLGAAGFLSFAARDFEAGASEAGTEAERAAASAADIAIVEIGV